MEQKVYETVEAAIGDSIKSVLTQYNSPLVPIINGVVETNSAEITEFANGIFMSALKSNTFKTGIKKAVTDKFARQLVAQMGGEIEKRVNELKQNPETRAKITLALTKVVNEIGG